jgi:hypothetical protein
MLSFIFALGGPAIRPSFAQKGDVRRAQQLEDEQGRLSRLKDPEARVESLMKIAGIRLMYVVDAIEAKDLPKLKSCLDEYRQTVLGARDTMMGSGLDAYKRPNGYKAIELVTRTHLRILEESARQLSLTDRPSLEAVIDDVSRVRSEMLRVLFS